MAPKDVKKTETPEEFRPMAPLGMPGLPPIVNAPPRFTELPPVPAPDPIEQRRQLLRNWFLWMTLIVLGLGVLVFLVSINAVISIWFREQWAPVARSVAALAVIGLCLFVLVRLNRRDAAARRA